METNRMISTVWKRFTFDAAHSLAHLPKSHKCHRLHGHTYAVTVFVTGPIDPILHWVIDYAEIKEIFNRCVMDAFDHKNLNECMTLPTTAENLARVIWHKLKTPLPLLSKIIVQETADSGVEYSE